MDFALRITTNSCVTSFFLNKRILYYQNCIHFIPSGNLIPRHFIKTVFFFKAYERKIKKEKWICFDPKSPYFSVLGSIRNNHLRFQRSILSVSEYEDIEQRISETMWVVFDLRRTEWKTSECAFHVYPCLYVHGMRIPWNVYPVTKVFL